MTRSQIRKYAFIKSIPIMCSYIFVSMAYGIMTEEVVLFFAGEPDRVYRRLPVCADHIFKQRSFYYNSGSHSTADEQPPEFLQHYLPEGIQTDGAPQAVHDSHDDR